jgi:hypothetical protein
VAEPTVQVTEYTVSLLPEGPDASSYEITVAYRGRGLWAVTRSRMCLGGDGEWDWEPLPSERTEEWLLAHRFDLDTALRLAKRAAPGIVVNGRSAADVAKAVDRG